MMAPRLFSYLKQSFPRIFGLVRDTFFLTFALFCKLSHQREIVVLTYHSIDYQGDSFTVDPEEFRRQIDYIRKNYAIVSLTEIVDFVKQKKELPRKSVAITFDDGSEDLFLNVYPYFCKNNLQATVFVTTGYVGKTWPFSSNHPKMLNWKQIEEISRNKFEIGAHTVSHPNLKEIDLEEAKNEILNSKKEIEEHVGKNVDFISYPFGKHTPEIIGLVQSLGFKGGVGRGGTVRKDGQTYLLNRVQVDRSVCLTTFKARLTKAVDFFIAIEQTAMKSCART